MKLKAYVINLEIRLDRWKRMKELWSSYFDLVRFPAIHNPRNGRLGCKRSHIQVAIQALQTSPMAIILEDDAVPTNWFQAVGMKCIEEAERCVEEWDYINLGPFLDLRKQNCGGSLAKLTPCASRWFMRSDYSHNTQSVLYNRRSLRLLERSLRVAKPIDMFLGQRALCQWVPIRLLSYQEDGYSDILRGIRVGSDRYKKTVRLLEEVAPDERIHKYLQTIEIGNIR